MSQKIINDDFWNFWENYEYQDSFANTVKYGEIALTTYFSSLGYTWDILIRETLDGKKFHIDGPDMTKNEPDTLLALGSPFIKKKSLCRITLKQFHNIVNILNDKDQELCRILQNEYKKNKPRKLHGFLNRLFEKMEGLYE